MSANATSVFKDLDVAKTLSTIHDKYVFVPAVLPEVDVENNSNDKTYTVTTVSKDGIGESHKSVLSSFCLSTEDGDCDLPCMYWIPKFHKNPFKQRHIAGSAKCTTKHLSKLLTSILTAAKESLQSYHNTFYPVVVLFQCGS